MYLVSLLTVFLHYFANAAFIDRINCDKARLQNMELLADSERHLIQRISEIQDVSDELAYFVEFLLKDSGHPHKESVELTLQYPLDRFKVVERFIYDWPMMQQYVDNLDIDIMAEFRRPGFQTPTLPDLVETVRELNEVIFTYKLSKDNITLLGSPGVDINPGNLLILTNISNSLRHVEACVMWGDAAHEELLTSDYPFTIPGEQYWVDFYLVYLECLVNLGSRDKQAAKVREEIMTHYRADPAVMTRVNQVISNDGQHFSGEVNQFTRCMDGVVAETWCYFEMSGFPPRKAEKVVGAEIVFYRDKASYVHSPMCRAEDDKVEIDNTVGHSSIHIVTRQSGTLVLYSGDSVKMKCTELVYLCTPLHGFANISN